MNSMDIIARNIGCSVKDAGKAAFVACLKALDSSVPVDKILITEADIRAIVIENGYRIKPAFTIVIESNN